MSFWRIDFRIRYDYPFAKISEEFPGKRADMWCAWNTEIIQVPLDSAGMMQDILELVNSHGLPNEGSTLSNGNHLLRLKCSCGIFPNVWDRMHSHNCFPVHPAHFLDGWAHYRMVSPSEDSMRSFLNELGEIGEFEITRKKTAYGDTMPPSGWVMDFVSDLTEMQIRSVERAFDLGYFSSPRRVTVKTVADSLGISKSTCEGHLREAENKLMAGIMPFTKLIGK